MAEIHLLYIGLGSNLGDGPANLDRALALIEAQVGHVVAVSGYVQSEPWGFSSTHAFTNAVCAVHTTLTPLEALDATQDIERQMGRTHKHLPGQPYTDRIIDLDLLTYDDLQWHDERLTLPHPLIDQRDFVREPLMEVKKLKS